MILGKEKVVDNYWKEEVNIGQEEDIIVTRHEAVLWTFYLDNALWIDGLLKEETSNEMLEQLIGQGGAK